MKITSRQTAYNGHFKVKLLTLEDGAEQLKRERFEPGTAVAALVWNTQQQCYLLTRQYRVGPESEIVELAAGMVDGEESPETAIRREIQEELGYNVNHLEQITRIYPSPGTSAEHITVFYAEVSQQSGRGGGLAEESENIETITLTLEQLLAEQFVDAKTIIAVQWLQLRS